MNLHLDTHVALWMVAGEKRRLRKVARRLQRSNLFISPIVIVEMEVLSEIGRLRSRVADALAILKEDYGVSEVPGQIRDLAHHARQLGWTRDPFDRLIVGHAQACGELLLTADNTILDNFRDACWSD